MTQPKMAKSLFIFIFIFFLLIRKLVDVQDGTTKKDARECHDLAKWLKSLFTFLFWTYYTRMECEKVSRD